MDEELIKKATRTVLLGAAAAYGATQSPVDVKACSKCTTSWWMQYYYCTWMGYGSGFSCSVPTATSCAIGSCS
jgi:hypothetical protein